MARVAKPRSRCLCDQSYAPPFAFLFASQQPSSSRTVIQEICRKQLNLGEVIACIEQKIGVHLNKEMSDCNIKV